MIHTCENCGDTYQEKIALDLTYNKVSAFTSGEKYVITVYSNKKYYALTHTNNKLASTQVTVSNNAITSEVTEDMLWDYSSNKLSYTADNNTYSLYLKSSGSFWFTNYSFELSTTNFSKITLNSNKIKVDSKYIKYSNGSLSASSPVDT